MNSSSDQSPRVEEERWCKRGWWWERANGECTTRPPTEKVGRSTHQLVCWFVGVGAGSVLTKVRFRPIWIWVPKPYSMSPLPAHGNPSRGGGLTPLLWGSWWASNPSPTHQLICWFVEAPGGRDVALLLCSHTHWDIRDNSTCVPLLSSLTLLVV